jgi:hypothetical protein
MSAFSSSGLMSRAMQFCWKAIRLPVGIALLALEPLLQFLCGFVVVVGVFVAVMFEISAVGPRFPFLQVTGICLSFGVILVLYYALLSFFVAD